jgi:hypothetical protein
MKRRKVAVRIEYRLLKLLMSRVNLEIQRSRGTTQAHTPALEDHLTLFLRSFRSSTSSDTSFSAYMMTELRLMMKAGFQ